MTCERSSSGVLDLYFYDELAPEEREATSTHVASCAQCREALDDLALISQALASRPAIASPPGGDWTGFMARLDAAVDVETRSQRIERSGVSARAVRRGVTIGRRREVSGVCRDARARDRRPDLHGGAIAARDGCHDGAPDAAG